MKTYEIHTITTGNHTKTYVNHTQSYRNHTKGRTNYAIIGLPKTALSVHTSKNSTALTASSRFPGSRFPGSLL
jgi:hypothetical protein